MILVNWRGNHPSIGLHSNYPKEFQMQGIIISVVIAIIGGSGGGAAVLVTLFPRVISAINSFNIANSLFVVMMWAAILLSLGVLKGILTLVIYVFVHQFVKNRDAYIGLEKACLKYFLSRLEKRSRVGTHSV
jgi:uncharacterized membrane protein